MYTYTKCFFNVGVATPGSRMDLSYLSLCVFTIQQDKNNHMHVYLDNLKQHATLM
jgi:hypothetical protein